MKASIGKPITTEEQIFWKKVKGLVFSDTTCVVVMAVVVFVSWVVMFF